MFTAHPTEAARRSTLTKLRAVADVLDAEAAEAALLPGPDARERTDRQLAEVIDLLWLTDELRRERPEPIDEARNAMFHLEDAAPVRRARRAAPTSRRCSPGSGSSCPITATPLRFGTWTGGDRDGNPNVTPAVTMQVLTLQHEQGIRVVERCARGARRGAQRVVPRRRRVRRAAGRRWPRDLERLPEVDARFRRINAEEPYRLKISCIRAKLARTRARLAAGAAAGTSRAPTTSASADLVADLELLRRSLAEHHGELVADGRLADAGAHGARHGPAPGDAWTCASTPTPTTSRSPRSSTGSASPTGRTASSTASQRTAWLVRELGGRRPLAGAFAPLTGRAGRGLRGVRHDPPGARPVRRRTSSSPTSSR